MVADAPLFIGPFQRARLGQLVDLAKQRPIDMPKLMLRMQTQQGSLEHRTQMNTQTIELASGRWNFYVTFSIEIGHPIGTCRHMSMSIDRAKRVPNPEAVWLIAKELGFTGESLRECDHCWMEDISAGGKAVNVLQLMHEIPAQIGVVWADGDG